MGVLESVKLLERENEALKIKLKHEEEKFVNETTETVASSTAVSTLQQSPTPSPMSQEEGHVCESWHCSVWQEEGSCPASAAGESSASQGDKYSTGCEQGEGREDLDSSFWC